MRRAETTMLRELDLAKYLKDQRMQMYALFAVLTTRQNLIIRKMST